MKFEGVEGGGKGGGGFRQPYFWSSASGYIAEQGNKVAFKSLGRFFKAIFFFINSHLCPLEKRLKKIRTSDSIS